MLSLGFLVDENYISPGACQHNVDFVDKIKAAPEGTRIYESFKSACVKVKEKK